MAAQRLESALRGVAPLVRQVIAQTEQRVLHGQSVPAAAKLVSLFEPHTAIVRRGKAHLPAEFGRKVLLDEVDGGLVTRFAVLTGNPPDAPELPISLSHHQMVFDQAPSVLTADRAFFTLDNEHLAAELPIRTVALPRQGPLTAKQQQVQHRARFDGPTAGGRASRVASACSNAALVWTAAAITATPLWNGGSVSASWLITSARSAIR